MPVIITLFVVVACTRSSEANQSTAHSGIPQAAAESEQHQNAVAPTEGKILIRIIVQKDGHRFSLENSSLRKSNGLVSDVQDLLWIAYRGGAGIDPAKAEERNTKDLEIVQESNESIVTEHTWIRLFYQPYKPPQGMNDFGHQDIMVYSDPQNLHDAYLAIQDPDDQLKWKVFPIPEYGSWLQKEIEIFLRLTTGL